MAERRNRTFEEIAREEEQKRQQQESKERKRTRQIPKLNLKVPRLFPRLKAWVRYAMLGLVVLLILGIANSYQNNQLCTGWEVKIVSNEQDAFLSQQEIEKMVEEGYQGKIVNERMGKIRLKQIEEILNSSPYMEDAQVSKTFKGKLFVEARLREPIARIINQDGPSIYIDKNGIKFPTRNRHSSHVPLIRGVLYESLTPKDSFACELVKNAMPVIKYISADPFWKTQISEIYLTQGNELIFYPQVGNLYVEFGEPKRIEEKFENMKLFYDQVVKVVGWNKYKGFSVKFKGQVIGKKT